MAAGTSGELDQIALSPFRFESIPRVFFAQISVLGSSSALLLDSHLGDASTAASSGQLVPDAAAAAGLRTRSTSGGPGSTHTTSGDGRAVHKGGEVSTLGLSINRAGAITIECSIENRDGRSKSFLII